MSFWSFKIFFLKTVSSNDRELLLHTAANEQPCVCVLIVLPFLFCLFWNNVCLLLNFCGRGWFMGSAQHSKVESSRYLSTALSPSCWSATLPRCTRLVGLVHDPVSHWCWSFQFLNPLSCWCFEGDRYRARCSKCREFFTQVCEILYALDLTHDAFNFSNTQWRSFFLFLWSSYCQCNWSCNKNFLPNYALFLQIGWNNDRNLHSCSFPSFL